MDPSRPFPPPPPPVALNFPHSGLISPISTYQLIPPSLPSQKSEGNIFPVTVPGSVVTGAPPSFPGISSASGVGRGVSGGNGNTIGTSGDIRGSGMSSAQRGLEQQQQQLGGQGRSNINSLSSSSSSAAYVPSSSSLSTVSLQQQHHQQDQQQGPHTSNENIISTDSVSGIRSTGPTAENFIEPPKKVSTTYNMRSTKTCSLHFHYEIYSSVSIHFTLSMMLALRSCRESHGCIIFSSTSTNLKCCHCWIYACASILSCG